MCISCHTMVEKRDLIRVVKSPDGEFSLDFTGKANGRGAYICNNPECIAKCIKTRALNRAFKENIDDSVYEKIKGEYERNQN